jgi:hypothetical protein
LPKIIRDGYTAIKDGNGNVFISSGVIYSPLLLGNAIIVKSNAGESQGSGFFIRYITTDANVFLIQHVTVGGQPQSFVRGANNTNLSFW